MGISVRKLLFERGEKMSQEKVMFLTVALMLGSWFIGNFIVILVLSIRENIKTILKVRGNNKEFRKKVAEVEAMKAGGDFHEWTTIMVGGKEVLVCKKTGWSPNTKSFISKWYIDDYLEVVKREEEYKEFKSERMLQLSDKYGISIEETERLVEQIFEIKKDFALKKMTELQEELNEKADVTNETGKA